MSDLIDRQVALKALADLRDEAKRSGLALAMLNRAIIAIRSLPAPHHYASLAADRITELEAEIARLQRDNLKHEAALAESKP